MLVSEREQEVKRDILDNGATIKVARLRLPCLTTEPAIKASVLSVLPRPMSLHNVSYDWPALELMVSLNDLRLQGGRRGKAWVCDKYEFLLWY